MKIVAMTGQTAQKAAGDIIHKIIAKAFNGKVAQDEMLSKVRSHVQSRYPGSAFWSPSKVLPGKVSKETAEIDVNIPGASRAYHDITIKPKRKQYLKIPFAGMAQNGKEFVLKTKRGSLLLARSINKSIQIVAVLAKSAFQHRDPSLMPSDGALAESIFSRMKKEMN